MFRSFSEVESRLRERGIVRRVALAGADDAPALAAVADARKKGLVQGVLIGDEAKVRATLSELGENEASYELVHEADEAAAAARAVAMVRAGEADIPMKGLMQTSSFMRAILNKETGLLPEGRILSQVTVFEAPDQGRLMFAADCAVNIVPGATEKAQIIKNTVECAHAFGIERPRVAVISAVEKVNPKIQSTLDADELAHMSWDDCVVEGPFALDNAVSPEAAAHKGIESTVAGAADVLIMPDLCAGNVLHKSLHYFGHVPMAGALAGTSATIMTSRTDSPESKFNSILTAIVQSL